jgi:multiple sugar transport system ATP-binding protein
MGRAIVRQPQAFLMDEPLSNLDAQLRVQMRGEIEALQKRLGVTTVYVTHDQVEAMTMGDRIAVLRDGVLQQVGTPGEVYDRPANLFVAGFIGSPPMNLARASVDGGTLRLGSHAIELDGNRPSGDVVVGIRPEDVHDARLAEGDSFATFPAQIDRVEALGSNLLAHFFVDAEAPKTAGVAAATGGEILEHAPLVAERRGASFIATFEPRAAVRAGDKVDIALDRRRLHFFDPETETSIASA